MTLIKHKTYARKTTFKNLVKKLREEKLIKSLIKLIIS